MRTIYWASAFALAASTAAPASAEDGSLFSNTSGRLLLTGGVSSVEGVNGGGLTPWALIGGYGTRDQIGVTGYGTYIGLDDFHLHSFGASVGLYNRVELSVARQQFYLEDLGTALGLGGDFHIDQTTYGVKVRLFGDAVLEQDSWVPQVSVGVIYKDNDEDAIVTSLGASDGDGFEYYVSATKLYLAQSLLLNVTLRMTEANQFGILGFGSAGSDYELQFEASAAYLLTRKLAIGAEYRTKPDNLGFPEDDAYDAFIAYAPLKNVSMTLAYVDLGNIVVGDQRGVYASLQVGF